MLKLCHGEKECHGMEQLRGDIASSRPMLTKGCCKGNNYEQRFARTTSRLCPRRSVVFCCLPCSKIATREACRLLQVVKVVFVVFPNSAGRVGNSTTPHSIFRKNQKTMGDGTHSIPHQGVMTVDQFVFSTLRRRIGRPPGPPGCGGTSTADRPWNSRWRKPHPGRRCWRRPVREDRCKYLLSYPLR